MKILSAHPNAVTRMVVSTIIERHGDQAIEVEVSDLLAELVSDRPYDAVVVSNKMVPTSGADVLHSLWNKDHLELPVIICTFELAIKPAVEQFGGIFVNKMELSAELPVALDAIATEIAKRKR